MLTSSSCPLCCNICWTAGHGCWTAGQCVLKAAQAWAARPLMLQLLQLELLDLQIIGRHCHAWKLAAHWYWHGPEKQVDLHLCSLEQQAQTSHAGQDRSDSNCPAVPAVTGFAHLPALVKMVPETSGHVMHPEHCLTPWAVLQCPHHCVRGSGKLTSVLSCLPAGAVQPSCCCRESLSSAVAWVAAISPSMAAA